MHTGMKAHMEGQNSKHHCRCVLIKINLKYCFKVSYCTFYTVNMVVIQVKIM